MATQFKFNPITGQLDLVQNLSGYVPTSRTITINGTTLDLSQDRSWTVSSSYILPIATASVLGGIKVGDRLSIDANGVLSADSQTPDLSAYWKNDGTSTATANWNIGNNNFTASGGFFSSLYAQDSLEIGDFTSPSFFKLESNNYGTIFQASSIQSPTVGGDFYVLVDDYGRVELKVTGGIGASLAGGAYFTAQGYQESWFSVLTMSNSANQRIMRFGNQLNEFRIQRVDDAGANLYTPFAIANSAPTNSYYMNSSGYSGFNTNNPQYQVDVNGGAQFNGNVKINPEAEGFGEGIQFYMPSSSTWGGLRWVRNRSNYYGSWAVGYTGLDSTNDLVFVANNAGTQVNNILRLTTAGLVGVNTATPQDAQFEIGSAITNQILRKTSGTDDYLQFINPSGVKTMYVDSTAQLAFKVDNGTYGPIYFGNFNSPNGDLAGFSIPNHVLLGLQASTLRMMIGGDTTIFSTPPASLLEVRGKSNEVQFSTRAWSTQTNHIFDVSSFNGTAGDLFTVNELGYVGMGKYNPAYAVDIQGTTDPLVRLYNPSGWTVMSFKNSSGNGSLLKFFNSSDTRVFEQVYGENANVVAYSLYNGTNFGIYTGAGQTVTQKLIVTNAGYMGIGTTTPSDVLDVVGSGRFSTSVKTPEIKTDYTTPTDLTITTGSAKTLVLATPVYNDIYTAVASAKLPASNYPDWTAFTTNTNAYTFKLNDYADLATVEVLHDYKEGTDLEVHLHLATNGLNNATERKVKYIVYYTWANPDNGANQFSTESSLTAELTIPANKADKTAYYLSLGTITGTNIKTGAQIKFRIKRIAGTGTEPINDPYLGMVGVHYQIDTLGSRSITSK